MVQRVVLGTEELVSQYGEGYYNVKVNSGGMESNCPLNYVYKVLYNPGQNKAMAVALGQECHFFIENPESKSGLGYDKCYDVDIIKSFRFLDATADWKTYKNEEYGFEIKYPENFFYQEPKVAVTDCSAIDISKECPDVIDAVKIITGYSSIDSTYWCLPMKQGPCDPKKQVEMLTSENIPWCLHTHSEGAAGSIYTEYYYTTIKDGKCFTLSLLVRIASSCKNYAKQEDIDKCEEFKESLPGVLDKVLSTFKFLE